MHRCVAVAVARTMTGRQHVTVPSDGEGCLCVLECSYELLSCCLLAGPLWGSSWAETGRL